MRTEKSISRGAVDASNATSILSRSRIALIALIVGMITFRMMLMLSPQRVGDGSEYYGLFLAIHEGHRTFMTDRAWEAYRRLFIEDRIFDLVDPNALKAMFPSLVQQSGADFNHFWLYSGLTAALAGWLNTLGISVHTCFLLLHALLLMAVVYVSGTTFGKAGLLSTAIVLMGSPIIWFIDKVHTEFFTFCCVSIATLLFCRRRYFPAAMWLALASTQNISISATSVFLLALAVWQARRHRLSICDNAMIMVTMALITIHPAYYFFRIGVIDPQLLAGGAKLGANLHNAYIWMLDPDVGLLPNWPMSVGILLMTATAMVATGFRPSRLAIAYVAVFLLTNLYAQSSTENINSGATIDIARYATWYIGLFIPCLAFVLQTTVIKCGWLFKTTVVALLLTATAANAMHFRPSRRESYLTPTPLSAWLQSKLPSLYDSPVQIFSERNSGSLKLPPSYAVLGPGCRKVLIVTSENIPIVPVARDACGLDTNRLPTRVLHPNTLSHILPDGRRQAYLVLTDQEIEWARPLVELNHTYKFGIGQPLPSAFLAEGWWQREASGVWSATDSPRLVARVSSCPATGLHMDMEVIAFVNLKNPVVNIQVESADNFVLAFKSMRTPGPEDMDFQLPCSILKNNLLDLKFAIKGQASPKQLGISQDDRLLGMGLRSFSLQTAKATSQGAEK